MITLHVQHLSKRYIRKQVLKDLSFTHESGILGIAGANGSGKSTLLKCFSFLLKPSKGTISWKQEGVELEKLQVKDKIGFAAPYINLYSELTGRENVEFIAKLVDKNDPSRIDEILEKMDAAAFKNEPFGNLSSGQKQRIKLAVALIRDPEILILDEPGTNLDKKGFGLIERIAEDAKEDNRFLVIASNDQKELDLCDQIITLNSL